ncbi:hypothetical protein TorRG33x02_348900, partial [Trema orientale]
AGRCLGISAQQAGLGGPPYWAEIPKHRPALGAGPGQLRPSRWRSKECAN